MARCHRGGEVRIADFERRDRSLRSSIAKDLGILGPRTLDTVIYLFLWVSFEGRTSRARAQEIGFMILRYARERRVIVYEVIDLL